MNHPRSSNPPDPEFERTLQAARGFFDLGMFTDAWDELEALAPETRHRPQVILLRVMIYNLERWEEASIIGKGVLRVSSPRSVPPTNPTAPCTVGYLLPDYTPPHRRSLRSIRRRPAKCGFEFQARSMLPKM